jgi:DNA mismatch endonuclease (patch repair protein)
MIENDTAEDLSEKHCSSLFRRFRRCDRLDLGRLLAAEFWIAGRLLCENQPEWRHPWRGVVPIKSSKTLRRKSSRDPLSPEARSERMALVRSANTRPEKVVRRALTASGWRYRLHMRSVPGTPDIAIPSVKVAIFVHGCFWHRHPGCSRTRTPKTRVSFWENKFQANVQRDHRTLRRVRRAGWTPVIVWECVSERSENLRQVLRRVLGKHGRS